MKNLDKITYLSNFSDLRYFCESSYGGCPKMSRNRIAALTNESYRRVNEKKCSQWAKLFPTKSIKGLMVFKETSRQCGSQIKIDD